MVAANTLSVSRQHVDMSIADNRHLINQIHKGALPNQYVRELVQNAIEAEASNILVTFDPIYLKESTERGKPTHRFLIADNGKGMTDQEIVYFMNHLSASSRDIGEHGNFGIGSKVACLPNNPHGMVVMTWPKDGSPAAMVRLWQNPQTGNYGIHRWALDGYYSEVAWPPEAYEEVLRRVCKDKTLHGTIITLWGNHEFDSTFMPHDEEGQTGVRQHAAFLNKRYYQIPSGVKINCVEGSRGQKDNRDWGGRYVKGAQFYLRRDSDFRGTVKLPHSKAEVEWYITQSKPNTHAYAHPRGLLAVEYKGELYNIAKSSDFGGTFYQRMLKHGITSTKVQKQLTLIVRPQPYEEGVEGVRTNPERSGLAYRYPDEGGDHDLPWDMWGREFSDHLPKKIRNLLKEAEEIDTEKVQEAVRDKLLTYMEEQKLLDGWWRVLKHRNRRPRRGTKKQPPTQQSKPPSKKQRKLSLPTFRWDEDVEDPARPTLFEPTQNLLVMFGHHPLLKKEVDYWTGRVAHVSEAAVIRAKNVVMSLYAFSLLKAIVSMYPYRNTLEWSDDEFMRALSPEALSTVVASIDRGKIARIMGGMLGSLKQQEKPQQEKPQQPQLSVVASA